MTEELTRVKRLGWSPYLGKTDTLVSLRMLGRYPVKVQDFWVPAVEAMEQELIDTGYENPCDWIGSYMNRLIAGTNKRSWHAYGGPVDLDYGGDVDGDGDPTIDKNPYVRRRIVRGDPGFGVEWQLLEHQVDAIEAIRTVNGKRVWRWLGWPIGDTMHFEPDCSPQDIATGIQEPTMPDDETVSNPAFQPAWDKAIEANIFSQWTKPSDVVTAEKLAVFLDRAGILDKPDS